jgi:hypothetical protein
MVKNKMKLRLLINVKLVASAVALFLATAAVAQDSSNTTAVIGTIEDLPARPFRGPVLAEINGSPFFTDGFRTADVNLGAKVVTAVPVRFNIMSNAMMVMKNGEELKLEFFESVSYTDNNGGEAKQVVFKAGFPEVDGHNDNSIYQVLSSGPKVVLLKYISQKVEDAATLGDYSRREIVTTEQLYVYTKGGGIKKIKKDKKSIVEALPEMSAKIEAIAGSKKLKTDSDITAIVEELNKP